MWELETQCTYFSPRLNHETTVIGTLSTDMESLKILSRWLWLQGVQTLEPLVPLGSYASCFSELLKVLTTTVQMYCCTVLVYSLYTNKVHLYLIQYNTGVFWSNPK